MYKILFLFLSFFNLNYQVITSKTEENIIYQDDYYLVHEANEKLVITTKNSEWIRNLELKDQYFIFNIDTNLYIFCHNNNKLEVIVYYNDGDIKLQKEVLDFKFNNLEIKYNNKFYLVGSIKTSDREVDGVIIEFDSELNIERQKEFGGRLNDYFYKLEFFEDEFIVAGKKDVLTGGDFGNGGKRDGSIFITSISNEFEILDIVTLEDNSSIIGLEYYKDYLTLVSEDAIYKFASNLELVLSNVINEKTLEYKIAFTNKLIIFSKEKIIIYDWINFKMLTKIDLDFEIINLKKFPNILFINNNSYLDIASLNNLKYVDEIYLDVIPSYEIETMFGKATLIEEISEKPFNNLIYGIYLRKLKYKSKFGLEFTVEFESKVNLEVNVTEGGIYPVGYNLHFTGDAYLNENPILNNYSIPTSGKYTLKLVGINNEEYICNFEVVDEQIKFTEEQVIDYDIITKKDNYYYLSLSYSGNLDNIYSVIIDGEEYFDLVIDKEEKILSVKMKALLESGLYYYVFDSICYEEAGNLRKHPVNKIYVVKVLEDIPNINLFKIDKFNYKLELIDDKVTRYFYLTYFVNNEEVFLKYPINNNKVNIPRILHNSKIKLGICYDLGDKSYQKIELMELEYAEVNENSILEIELTKLEDNSKELNFKINKKNLETIKVMDEVVFIKEVRSYEIYIIIGVVLAVLSFITCYYIRSKRLKNTEN